MKKIPLKIRIMLIVLFLLALPAYIFINILIDSHKDGIKIVYTVPAEYRNLFKSSLQDSLKIIITCESKTRNPYSELSFQNDTFNIVVCEISLKDMQSLPSVTTIEHSLEKQTMNITYHRQNLDYFKLEYISGVPSIGNKLVIGYNGSRIIPIMQNDSTIIYDAEVETLSIKYDKTLPVDFYLYSKQRTPESKQIPLNIGFIRRNNKIYFLILCKSSNNAIKQHEQLQNLLN